MSEESEEFDVEKIVGKRVKNNQTEYLIKWLGYSDSYNTWEPLDNLDNIKDMVQEFEKQNTI